MNIPSPVAPNAPDLSWIEDAGAFRRLVLLFTLARSAWTFGVYSREQDRDLLIDALREEIAPIPLLVVSFHDCDPDPLATLRQIPVRSGEPAPVVCFTNVLFAIPALALHLDLQREDLARMPHRLLFWVSSAERIWLFQHAPNFCSRLSGSFFFDRAGDSRPQPGPLLALLTKADEDLLPRRRPRPPVGAAGALRLADQILEDIRSRPPTSDLAQALVDVAALLELAPATSARAMEIYETYRRAADVAGESGDPLLRAESLWRAAAVARFEPNLLYQVRALLEEAAGLFDSKVAAKGPDAVRAEIGRAATLVGLASCDLMDGALGDAVAKLEKAARSYYEMGLYAGQAQSLKSLGAIAGMKGDWHRANAALEAAVRIFERLARNDQLAASLQLLGDAYARQGRAEALDYFERSLALARETRDLLTEGNALLSKGHFSLAAGNLEEAEGFYLDSLTVLRNLAFEPAVANVLMAISSLLESSGRAWEAAAARADAVKVYRRWGLQRVLESVAGSD